MASAIADVRRDLGDRRYACAAACWSLYFPPPPPTGNIAWKSIWPWLAVCVRLSKRAICRFVNRNQRASSTRTKLPFAHCFARAGPFCNSHRVELSGTGNVENGFMFSWPAKATTVHGNFIRTELRQRACLRLLAGRLEARWFPNVDRDGETLVHMLTLKKPSEL